MQRGLKYETRCSAVMVECVFVCGSDGGCVVTDYIVSHLILLYNWLLLYLTFICTLVQSIKQTIKTGLSR